jgi:DNA-directed RNA polymerase subunit L/DNA-directed RNA polymerase alpha subunit
MSSAKKFQFARKGLPASGAVPAESVFKSVVQQSKVLLNFTLNPTDVAYANTLRRVILTEVETIGFRAEILENGATSDVNISKNSTPMSNEMLSHRIGLLPIFVSNPLEWNPEHYSFKLDVTNTTPNPLDVKAGDIQVFKNRGPDEEPLKIPSTEFFHPDPISKDTALLAVLKGAIVNQENERFTFTAKATAGIGRENARFSPVSQCSYKYTLDTSPERRKEFFNTWLHSHKKVDPASLEGNAVKKGEFEREFATMEIDRCFLTDEKGEPYSFDFVVESIGILDPYYIVARAIQVIQMKLIKYASIDKGDLPESVTIRPADAHMKGYDFLFKGEDHTLGNLLQTWMDANLLDAGEITFIAYKVPHPLKDEMLLRVGVEDGKETSARTAIVKAIRALGDMFKGWGTSWASSGGVSASVPVAGTIRSALDAKRTA